MKTKRYRLPIALCALLVLLLVGSWSCRRSKPVEQPEEFDGGAEFNQGDEPLLYAIDSLNGSEAFSSADSLRELSERFGSANPSKTDEPIDPLLAAWPQPEAFRQVVNQVRLWVRAQPADDWKLDPMMSKLPKALRELPQVKNLGKLEFTPFDGFALQEAAWLHDISRSAQGDAVNELDRARSLFDWVVRNIQIEPDRTDRIPQLPRETLLFGRGTTAERVWVFMLLLRQWDMDSAILAIPVEGPEAAGTSKSDSKPGSAASSTSQKTEPALQAWCVGVLIDKEVYLFDPRIGLPLPGPGGVAFDDSGQLTVQPATLTQVAADAKLLRRLDIDASHPYSVKSVDPNRVTALLEASPPYLSRPMKLIESRLVGDRHMVLTASPTAQAERWKAARVMHSRLWPMPYQTLARRERLDWRTSALWLKDMLPLFWVYRQQTAGGARATKDYLEYDETKQAKQSQVITHVAPLFKGRVLYFKGKFGEEGAAGCYRIARPSLESLALSSESEFEKQIKLQAKQDASYWFGLMAFQRGRYPSAIDWLQLKTLEAYPNGQWSNGARYNLARAYEASGNADMAIFLYTSNTTSPGYAGDLLRARWLKELGEKRKPEKE